MIFVLEHNWSAPAWKPGRFKGRWDGRTTRRFWWLCWSLSWYPSKSLGAFFDQVEDTEWKKVKA